MKPGWKVMVWSRSFIQVVLGAILIVSCQTQAPVNFIPPQQQTVGLGNENQHLVDWSPEEEQVRFISYSVDAGLSMNTVHDILQDDTGYIWIATEDGLNRFDGYGFKIYRGNPSDSESIGTSNIQTLFKDQDGYLWFGGYEGGITRYDPYRDQLQHYAPSVGNRDIKTLVVNDIVQDQAGVFWFGTNDGLYRYEQESDEWSFFQSSMDDPTSLSSNNITALLIDLTGQLWLGTDQGLDKLDSTSPSISFLSGSDPQASMEWGIVHEIYQDGEEALWMGTDEGLIRFDPLQGTYQQWQNDPEDTNSISDNSVSSILEYPLGYLWVGTRKGLNLFNMETEEFSRFISNPLDPESLRDDYILELEMDRSGGLWIATAYGGANYFQPLAGQFKHYLPNPSPSEGIVDNYVWTVFQDDQDTLWLGTNGSGLKKCILEPFSCSSYRHDEEDPSSLGNDVILDIDPDGSDGLWIATWGGGLNHFDPQTGEFEKYQSIPGDSSSISSDVVWLIYKDRQGTYWIGTESGLNTFDPDTGQFERYLHNPEDENSISNDMIVGLFEDSTRTLWVGTQDGLNRLERETSQFTRFYHDPTDPDSLSHNTVFAFYEDEIGTLWIGTYGGGLNRFDRESETFDHYRVSEGLVNDSIYGILTDDAGNLWISTNNGISMFDPENESFKNFGIEDGIQAREFNFNGYYKNEQGEMFFSGVNGVTSFYPDQIVDNPYPPDITLQAITQMGIPLELDQGEAYLKELTLRWPNNFFDFEFAALSYYQAEQNQHAYMLENFDDDWNMIGNQRNGRYTNLPGGTYTLRIKGANNDGLWNEVGKSIIINVVPPFWQNPWIFVSVGFVVLASVVLGYRYRVHTLKSRATELEAQIEIRTNEINARRREIEALYKADEDLYRHLELDQVLQALVDTAVEILKADKGSLLCWDEEKQNLVIRAAHNFSPETVAETCIPRGSGVVGQVTSTGETIAIEDAKVDPRVTLTIVDAENIRSFIQVPIKTGDEVFGVFSADYAQPRTFSDDEKRLLMSLAQRAAVAIQNAQIYEQAQELAASQERNRLARELHDAVTQTLFSASLIAEALPALWERDPEKGRERLTKLRQMSRGALAEMRALLLELRPAALLETGLNDLLKQLGEAVMGRESIHVDIQVEGDGELPADVHIALYRIAQEAVNNIVKHARASNVSIHLEYIYNPKNQLSGVDLIIKDDGRGFRSQEPHPERLGIGIMRERAESIGAYLDIVSNPDEGTSIIVNWLN